MSARVPVTVLVVDDDEAVAGLHVRFVEAHPACAVIGLAHTGPDAVQAMQTLAPDIVLLDVYLPGFDGLEALQRVRVAGGKQPEVIAVTAARDIESVRRARSAGVRHYLVKPFSPAELLHRLNDVVRESITLDAATDNRLDQRYIDSLLTSRRATPPALPKGLSRETLELVEKALAAESSQSAEEIGARAGISRVSARRYLEHLAASGASHRTLDYGTAGRPAVRYSLVTEPSRSPTSDDVPSQ